MKNGNTNAVPRLIAAALLAGCISTPRARLKDDLSRGAYDQVLHETAWICGSRYGIAGQFENRTATAIRILSKEPLARGIFLQLLVDAPPAGKLYALCGLYYADRRIFAEKCELFRGDTREIRSTDCDVVVSERVCDLVFSQYSERDVKPIVLREGQTLKQWHLENPGRQGFMDLSGGSYPDMIMNPPASEPSNL